MKGRLYCTSEKIGVFLEMKVPIFLQNKNFEILLTQTCTTIVIIQSARYFCTLKCYNQI